jgi:apolipoprotein N-acyltransferase
MFSEEATVKKGILFLLLLTVASSLLISVSFPPLDFGFCAWFGLAPLLFALRQRGFVEASFLGFLFGSLFGIGAHFWTLHIDAIDLLKFVTMLIMFSIYFLVFGIFYKLITGNLESWTLIGGPALWITLEFMRSNMFFLSWPWNLLGHSQHSFLPVIQIADVTGVYGTSFLLVMVNQFLSEVPELFKMRKESLSVRARRFPFDKRLVEHLLSIIFVGLITFSYGWYKLNLPDSGRHLRIALIQANVLTRDDMTFTEQKLHMMKYVHLTRDAAMSKPDLVVWPSSSIPAPISNRFVRLTVLLLAKEIETYILVGGAGHEKDSPKKEGYFPYSNSEFLISPQGGFVGQYNKIRLLPFNEYVPLQGKFTWPEWITSVKESFIAGTEYTLFHAVGTKFSTPICWENIFPEFFRRFVDKGAQFMVSVTNEGFLGHSSSAGPYQTLAINVFRAVENRVAVARAATTGVSCFINPNGEIVDRIKDGNGNDLFVPGILIRDIPLSDRKTFYTNYGDIFAYVIIAITVMIILGSAMRAIKKPS